MVEAGQRLTRWEEELTELLWARCLVDPEFKRNLILHYVYLEYRKTIDEGEPEWPNLK